MASEIVHLSLEPVLLYHRKKKKDFSPPNPHTLGYNATSYSTDSLDVSIIIILQKCLYIQRCHAMKTKRLVGGW